MKPETDANTLYFSAGRERWTGELRAVKTRWRRNVLVAIEPVDSIPEGELVIWITKQHLADLKAGRGVFDKPWHQARQDQQDQN